MKNTLKAMKPYIIFNAIVFGVIGIFIGKNIVNIRNTSRKISADSKALQKWIKECKIKIENIDEIDVPEDIRKKADPRDPMDPTVIYVYN